MLPARTAYSGSAGRSRSLSSTRINAKYARFDFQIAFHPQFRIGHALEALDTVGGLPPGSQCFQGQGRRVMRSIGHLLAAVAFATSPCSRRGTAANRRKVHAGSGWAGSRKRNRYVCRARAVDRVILAYCGSASPYRSAPSLGVGRCAGHDNGAVKARQVETGCAEPAGQDLAHRLIRLMLHFAFAGLTQMSEYLPGLLHFSIQIPSRSVLALILRSAGQTTPCQSGRSAVARADGSPGYRGEVFPPNCAPRPRFCASCSSSCSSCTSRNASTVSLPSVADRRNTRVEASLTVFGVRFRRGAANHKRDGRSAGGSAGCASSQRGSFRLRRVIGPWFRGTDRFCWRNRHLRHAQELISSPSTL